MRGGRVPVSADLGVTFAGGMAVAAVRLAAMTSRWLIALSWTAASAARAEPSPVEKTALAVLEQQVIAVRTPRGLLAALSPDTVVLGNGSFALASDRNAPAVAQTISRLPIIQTFITRFSAGSRGDVLWIDADVTFADGGGCGASTARIVELGALERGRWHPLAVAFTSTSGLAAAGDELAPAAQEPLTTYLGSQSALDDALRDDPSTAVIVAPGQGTGELAHGRDAGRHVLAPFHDRRIAINSAIEVHGRGWGFASGVLTMGAGPHGDGAPLVARAVVFAILDHQRWSVVAVQMTTDAPRDAPPCPAFTDPIPLPDQLINIEP